MKPIYLKMRAFGSYREETIDFSHVNHGVFLVTGDTGAGKTTIFDAITYALYGESSGGRRDGEMMVSQYAKKGEYTEVEFSFSYGEDVYTVRRFPRQKKYKETKGEDGTVTYKALKTERESEAELVLADGTIFSAKKREVDEKIQEILGIDAGQFTQIAMLAQGDFLKLLHARSDERKKIFSKLFDTGLYYFVEKELEGRFKHVYGQLEDNRKQIETYISGILCGGDSRYYGEWQAKGEFSEDGRDDIIALAEGILEELNAAYNEAQEKRKRAEAQREAVQKELMELKSVNQDFLELHKALEEKVGLEKRAAEMEEVGLRLHLADKALKVEGRYTLYMDKKEGLAERREAAEALKWQLAQAQENMQKIRKEYAEAEEEYEKKYPVANESMISLKEKLPAYEELQTVQALLKTEEKEAATKEKEREGAEKNWRKCREEQEQVKGEVSLLRERTQREAETARNRHSLEKLLEEQKECLACMKKEQEYGAKIKERKDALAGSEREWRAADDRYQQLYDNFLSGQIPALRAKLVQGRPCPVCGSVHHSEMETEAVSLVRQEDVEEARDHALSLEKVKTDDEKKLQHLETLQMENRKQMEKFQAKEGVCERDAGLPALAERICANERAAGELKVQEQEIREAKDSLAKKEKLLEKAAAKEESLKERIGALEVGLAKLAASLQGHREEEKKLAAKLPYRTREEAEREMENCRTQIRKMEADRKRTEKKQKEQSEQVSVLSAKLEAEQAAVINLEAEEEGARHRLEAALEKQGFPSVEEYRNAYMEDEERERLKADLEAYRKKLNDVAVKAGQLQERTRGKEPLDETVFEEQLKAIRKDLDRLQKEEKHIYADRQTNEHTLAAIKRSYASRDALGVQYGVYKRLYDTAHGSLKGKKGIDFQTYVQRRYFKQVIDKANQRLLPMSRNQFILKCRNLEDLDNRGSVGLDLDVYSIVNDDTRDVKSLSGGESFMAALSMALGLSDLIQSKAGRVRMDTMFIDEGFGSLSEDTRNQALSMLNELSEGSRLIGIISHVTELKAQVETKLVVKKTDGGSRAYWES